MTVKARKSTEPTASALDVSADERHQDDVDRVITDNRDALNASIRRARKEIGQGIQASRTIDDIISDGLKRHGAD